MTPRLPSSSDERPTVPTPVVLIALAVLVAAGLWLRLRHLGELGLVVDEGIQLLALTGILDQGIPRTDGGAIYSRALLFLYTQAGCAKLFGTDPFWLRLPAVLFGVAVIPLTFVLGATLFDRRVGLVAAAFIALSSWEIELARYARFYTLFQFAYCLALWQFYRGFLDDHRISRAWFLLAAFAAFFTHHLSLALVTCFLIPLPLSTLTHRKKVSLTSWIVPFGALLLAYREIGSFFRGLGAATRRAQVAAAPLETTVRAKIQGLLGVPDIELPDLTIFSETLSNAPWLVAIVCISALAASAMLVGRLRERSDIAPVALGVAALAAGTLHQFGIVLTIGFAYVLALGAPFRGRLRGFSSVTAAGTLATFAIWLVRHAVASGLTWKEIALSLVGFPDITRYMLYWLVLGWPLFTALLVAGCVILLVRWSRARNDRTAIFLLGAIFFPAIIASCFPHHQESRYLFHLYPLMVVVVAMVAVFTWTQTVARVRLHPAVRAVLGTVAFVALLVATRDADPVHALGVGSRTYLTPKDPIRSVINWPAYAGFHQDHRTPGEYVAEHRSAGDAVLACGPVHMIVLYHLYAEGADYALAPAALPRYYARAGGGDARRNYLTASRIVAGTAGLDRLLAEPRDAALWILCDERMLSDEAAFYEENLRTRLRELLRDPDVVGRDGLTVAKKIGP